jgi:hypothetical protein
MSAEKMRGILLAEFPHGRLLVAAARAASRRHVAVLDAFTPFPVEGLAELMPLRPSRIRLVMLLGGIAIAAMAYGGEIYTAVFNYPYNSGGRPLNSWPAFMLVPFATGILGATIAGLAAFLVETGLPRLHFSLFATERFDRVTQDRFMLAVAQPETDDEKRQAIDWLHEAGAVAVREVET